MDRKNFLKTSSSAGLILTVMPFSILTGKDDRKVRLGFIGTGSRGGGHLRRLVNRSDVEVMVIKPIKNTTFKL